jgi:hypothetical protein
VHEQQSHFSAFFFFFYFKTYIFMRLGEQFKELSGVLKEMHERIFKKSKIILKILLILSVNSNNLDIFKNRLNFNDKTVQVNVAYQPVAACC